MYLYSCTWFLVLSETGNETGSIVQFTKPTHSSFPSKWIWLIVVAHCQAVNISWIFMMRTCLRIYKIIQKCEKKKAIGATLLQNMKSQVGTIKLSLRQQCVYSLPKSTKGIFKALGAWTSTTMVHGQTFRFITWHPHREGTILSSTSGMCLSVLCVEP